MGSKQYKFLIGEKEGVKGRESIAMWGGEGRGQSNTRGRFVFSEEDNLMRKKKN